MDLIRDTSHLIGKEVCSFSYSKEKSSCVKKWELSDVVGLRSSNLITRPWRMVLRGGAVATLLRASTRWVVVQFDCHPEASVLCAAKDLGEPREASRSCDEIIAPLARFLTKLHHQHRLRSCTHRSILVKIVVSGIIPHTSGETRNL